MIEITTNTANLLIDVLRDYIFKLTGDEHSDSATHPIEVALLDLLLEKRMEEGGAMTVELCKKCKGRETDPDGCCEVCDQCSLCCACGTFDQPQEEE